MISLLDAQAHVLARVKRLPTERINTRHARGRVTAEAVTAAEFIPPFANTAVDGYAVRSEDVATADDATTMLEVVGTLAAGRVADVCVNSGEALKIMTGAPMPEGADAVVMVERTTPVEDRRVRIEGRVEAGAHVRGAGEDLVPGDVVFGPGTVLSSGHLGVLASLGEYEVDVYRRPTLGVFSTGDELVEGPGALAPGQIRDANRHTLIALAERDGFDVLDLGIIADDEALIESAIRSGSSRCDALATSGGVSMGDYDYVKAVLDRIGDMEWMQVAIKPAKPLAFGVVDKVPIFGLPGNPVSAMVSYELFARPGLRKMMGHDALLRPSVAALAGQDMSRRSDGKVHFARVVVEVEPDGFVARFAGGQGSHQLTAMAAANALAVLPDGPGISEGERVRVLILD